MMQLRQGRAKARVAPIPPNNLQYAIYAGCVQVSSSDDIGFAIGMAERYVGRGYSDVTVQDMMRRQVIWEGGE